MNYHIGLAVVAMLTAPAIAEGDRKRSITAPSLWSRASSPSASVGAGYLPIRNSGAQSDRRVGSAANREAYLKTLGDR